MSSSSDRSLATEHLASLVRFEFTRNNPNEAQRLLTWLETLEGMSDAEFDNLFKEENE